MRRAVIVDPARLQGLVAQWRRQARLIEQAGACKWCPVGGTATALRECAKDAEALLVEDE